MQPRDHALRVLLVFHVFAIHCFAELLLLNVNLRKPVAVTDDKFLSLNVDPGTLLHAGNALSTDFERSVNLARALAPAYVRFGGPSNTFYQFSGDISRDNLENRTLTVSDWVLAHQWAQKSGLDVIACISPENLANDERTRTGSIDDATEIVSFDDHMGYNTSWQLGYECQTRCNVSAKDLARRVLNLREILNKFPRYSNSMIIGPDVVSYEGRREQKYLREYFEIAAPALSAITWHPDFADVTLDNEGVLIQHDDLDKKKEELFKVIGRFVGKRPLWIAESNPEESSDLYLGALIFTRRLGNAAKSKVEVVMRQPLDLTYPDPAYWASLLHKTLVGREVFDAKIQTAGSNHVYLYSHCARASNRYRKGSVTIFGVNLSPDNVAVALKGTKITRLHEYLLSPGFDAINRMFAESVLLNNKLLHLANDTVPELEPVILKDPRGLELNLQSGGIGFWVLPDLKIRSCMESREENASPAMEKKGDHTRVPRDLRERFEGSRKSRIERRRQKAGSRLARRADTRRELDELKKFVKTKLDDDDDDGTSSSAVQGKVQHPQSANDQLESQEDTRTTLEKFKDRLSRIRDLSRDHEARTAIRDSISEMLGKIVALISKVRDAIETARRERNQEDSSVASVAIKDRLKSLYNLLTNVNLESIHAETKEARRVKKNPIDGDEVAKISQDKTGRPKRDLIGGLMEDSVKLDKNLIDDSESRRSKRDLGGAIAEISGRDNPSRISAKERRKMKGNSEVRKAVQPSVFEVGSSEENTFYGFFKTEPVEGFPEGDVFLAAGDRDYDETSDQETGRDPQRKPENEDAQDERNYRETNDFYEKPKSLSKPASKNAATEIWEAETYEQKRNQRDDQAEENKGIQLEEETRTEKEKNKLRRLKSARARQTSRINRENRRSRFKNNRSNLADQKMDPVSKYFSMESDVEETKRPKRKSVDLNAIFDQEMINEDDANSKDCKCRVIRSKLELKSRPKRQASGHPESETETETVPAEEVPIYPNLDEVSILEESPDTEALELETEAPSLKVERETILDFQETEPEIGTVIIYTDSDGSALEDRSDSPRNLDDSTSKALESLESSSLRDDESLAPKTSVRREDTFFRDQSLRNEEETTEIDSAFDSTSVSSGWETSTPSSSEDQDQIQETSSQNSQETSEPETPGSTTDFPTSTTETEDLSVETVTREPQNDNHSDNVTGGSFHGRMVEGSPEKSTESKEKRESSKPGSNSRRNRKRTKSPAIVKPRQNDARSPEARIMDRARALLTLRKELDQRRGRRVMGTTPRSTRIEEYRRNRAEQIRNLRQKLRDDQERMLQQYRRDVAGIAEDINDEEMKSLTRREAWRAIQDSDDFRDMIDRENLAYVLMYSPSKHETKREDDESEESSETVEVPATEVVTGRNVRRRVVGSKDRQSFRDPVILEHSNPHGWREKVVQLRHLYENEAERRERLGGDREVGSYFALVEDLREPRIFPKFREDKRRSVQTPTPYPSFYRTKYRYQPNGASPYLQNMETVEGSSAEDEEDEEEELPTDREIYVIDPSQCRVGEVPPQFYRTPSMASSDKVYQTIWGPASYGDRTELYKRDDKASGENPQESNEETNDPGKFRDLSGNLNGGELLRILINALDARSAEELLNRFAEHNAMNVDKRNFMRSTAEETSEEAGKNYGGIRENEELVKIGEDEGSSEERESFETTDTDGYSMENERTEADSERSVSNEGPEGNSDEEMGKIRKRRDLSSFLTRKDPYEIKKNDRNNYSSLTEELKEASAEDSSNVFKMAEQNKYYKTVPSRNFKMPLPLTRKNEDRDVLPLPKILIPSKLNEYSSIDEKDLMIGKENSYERSSCMDHREETDFSKESEELFDSASSDSVPNISDTIEEGYGEPEVVMVPRWADKFGRHRRRAENQAGTHENENIEKVETLELQNLEEFSSPRIPTSGDVDDVERSIAEKKPLKKYTEKENSINERKNAGGSNNEDQGLSSFLEESIPKLGNVVVNSLEKSKNLTESVEQLIENLDEKFNETATANKGENSVNPKSINATQTVFEQAITNVKKFFMLLGGISRAFRGSRFDY